MDRKLDDPDMLACPFCGRSNRTIERPEPEYFGQGFWVSCVKCGAKGPFAENHDGAVEKWNGRGPTMGDDIEPVAATKHHARVAEFADRLSATLGVLGIKIDIGDFSMSIADDRKSVAECFRKMAAEVEAFDPAQIRVDAAVRAMEEGRE